MKYPAVIITLLLLRQDILSAVTEGERCLHEAKRVYGRCLQPIYCNVAHENFLNQGERPTFCEYSPRRILICCADGTEPQADIPPVEPPVWDNNKSKLRALQRVSERKCAEYTKDVEPTGFTGDVYIYGGSNASPGDYPHMGAIGWLDFHGEYNFNCGGSLISPRFILTAGHCTSKARAVNPKPVIVRLGSVSLDPASKRGDTIIDVKIKRIHKHPEYRPPLRYNDIALLELAEDMNSTLEMHPACLWTRPDFGEHKNVIATGWGVTENTTVPINVLQWVKLSLFSNGQCNPLIRKDRHWDGFAETQMCAGELSGGKDTCYGDSGAPLQVKQTKSRATMFHIMGITSFGGRCAQKGQPAIYTRVSSYLDWIESIVWPDE